MADATEIAALVVKLTGDGSDYAKMMKEAEGLTVKAVNNLKGALDEQSAAMKRGEEVTASYRSAKEKYARKVEEVKGLLEQGAISQETFNRAIKDGAPAVKIVNDKLKELTTTLLKVFATFGATKSLWGAFEKNEIALEAMGRLTAAIELNGHEAEGLIKQYEGVAVAITKVSLATKGQVMGLFEQAEAYGLSGKAAENVAKHAVALGAFMKTDASSQVRLAIAYEEGNVAMLKRIPALRGITDKQEIMAKFLRVIATGERDAAEAADSTSGKMEKLWKTFAGLSKEVGILVEAVLRPLVIVLEETMKWFNALGPTAKSITVAVLALSAAVPATIAGFAILQTIMATTLLTSFIKATAAVYAFTVALLANPVTWIVLGVAALAAGIAYAGASLIEIIPAVKAYNDELARTKKIQEQVQTNFKSQTAQMIHEALGGTKEERYAQLETQLEEAKRVQRLLEEQKQGTVGAGRAVSFIKYTQPLSPTGQAEANLAHIAEMAKLATDRVEDLEKALKKEGPAGAANASTLRDIKEFNRKLQDQIGILALVEAEEKKLYKFRKDGATDADLQNSRALLYMEQVGKAYQKIDKTTESINRQALTMAASSDEAELLKLKYDALAAGTDLFGQRLADLKTAMENKAVAKLQVDVEKFIESLQRHNATMGMSSNEAKLFNLQMEAAARGIELTAEQLERIRALMKAGDSEKYLENLQKAGEAVSKQFMQPAEKFAERMEKLNEMLKEGVISEQTFALAADDARKKLEGQRKELQKLDAALAGSADAQARYQSYIDRIKEPGASDIIAAADVKERARIGETPNIPAGGGDNTIDLFKTLIELSAQIVKNTGTTGIVIRPAEFGPL